MKELVTPLLDAAFDQRPELFLLSLDIQNGNEIRVVIDGDRPVSIEDCIFVSRQVEHNLDRDELDFSLDVTTPGVTQPLEHPRQYNKNVGRTLKIRDKEGNEYKALVESIKDGELQLEWSTREKKETGKGKRTVQHVKSLPIDAIEKAKVIITF